MNLQLILTVLQIISIIMSLIVTTFGFLVKRELKRLDDADLENKKKLEEVEKEMLQKIENCNKQVGEFRKEVADNYVKNTEFIRVNSEVMKKLDKIFDILLEMKGRDLR